MRENQHHHHVFGGLYYGNDNGGHSLIGVVVKRGRSININSIGIYSIGISIF